MACYLDETFLSNGFELRIRPWTKVLRFASPILLAVLTVSAFHFARYTIPLDILMAPAALTFFLLILALSYAIPCAIEKQNWPRTLALSIFLSASGLLAYETVIVTAYERRTDSPAFFAELSKRLQGRTLIMYAENLNEAVWYLDADKTHREIMHLRRDPKNATLQLNNALILMPTDTFNTAPDMKSELTVESTLQRGATNFTLATGQELKSMSLDPSLESSPAD